MLFLEQVELQAQHTIEGDSHLCVLTHLEVVDNHAGQGGGRTEDAACRNNDVNVAGHKSCLYVQERQEEEEDTSLLKAYISLLKAQQPEQYLWICHEQEKALWSTMQYSPVLHLSVLCDSAAVL